MDRSRFQRRILFCSFFFLSTPYTRFSSEYLQDRKIYARIMAINNNNKKKEIKIEEKNAIINHEFTTAMFSQHFASCRIVMILLYANTDSCIYIYLCSQFSVDSKTKSIRIVMMLYVYLTYITRSVENYCLSITLSQSITWIKHTVSSAV